MTFYWGILIGALGTISVGSVSLIIAALVAQSRKKMVLKMVPDQFKDHRPPLG